MIKSRKFARCRKCRARSVHGRNVDVNGLICAICESKLIADVHRQSNKPRACECSGYHYPHRYGSPDCLFLPDGSSRWEDYSLPGLPDEEFPF